MLPGIVRVCCLIAKTLLGGALVIWVALAPLVWILRDGLGPGMVESNGLHAGFKFLVGWGIPAGALAVPLIGAAVLERLLAESTKAEEDGVDEEKD